MSKIKMRCITCGKWFQSANAKEVTCPDCMQKARKEKMVSKTAPPDKPVKAGAGPALHPPVPPKPTKSAQGGTNSWLDALDDVKISPPEQPPPRPKFPPSPVSRDTRSPFSGRIPTDPREEHGERGNHERSERGPGNYRDERGPAGYGSYREGSYRGPGGYRVGGGAGIPDTFGQRPRPAGEGNFGPRTHSPGEHRFDKPRPGTPRGGKPATPKEKKPPRAAATPKPKREKIPPPQPFMPTPEQVAQVEARYSELAIPSEFDGIRTQIAKELSMPKKAVKTIIKDFRDRQEIPSWWELQVYKGSTEELETIKKAYEPYLPLPPVGVHKNIAETLSMKPGIIYQAIKSIRQEMSLPQYNDPTLHGLELKKAAQNGSASSQHTEEAASVTTPATVVQDTSARTPPAETQVSVAPFEETVASSELHAAPTTHQESTQLEA